MPIWYMPGVEHGDLANRRTHFEALRDLLVEGGTTALPQRPPVSRGADAISPIPEHEPAYYPDEAAILANALWVTRRCARPSSCPRSKSAPSSKRAWST